MGRRHAEQLALRTRGARLVAACSPLADERDWAGRELGVPALYDDFAALLRDPQAQALAIVEFDGGARAQFYASRTLAHGRETSTAVIGTAGSVSVGVGAHRDRVQGRDAGGVHHRVLADFVERFAEAFRSEMAAFVAACLGEVAPPLTLQDANEATRIGVAITKSLKSGQVKAVV